MPYKYIQTTNLFVDENIAGVRKKIAKFGFDPNKLAKSTKERYRRVPKRLPVHLLADKLADLRD